MKNAPSPANPPRYLSALLEQLQDPGSTRGGLSLFTVMHDDWCALLNGKGECNCDPIVRPGGPRG